MGLTYDGGFNILNYIYNNVDDLGTGAVQDQIYNGFEIELQEADGTPYVRGTQTILCSETEHIGRLQTLSFTMLMTLFFLLWVSMITRKH